MSNPLDHVNKLIAMQTADISAERKYFASVLWRLTKNMNLAELMDYDDELGSDVKEARAKAHLLLFGVEI